MAAHRLALAGALLLGDAVALMLTGLINFGVVLPGAIGTACLALSWRWEAVAQWRTASARHRWIWRAGWTAFAVWLTTVAVFFYFTQSQNWGASCNYSGALRVMSSATIPENSHYDLKAFSRELRHVAEHLLPQLMKKLGTRV